MVDYQNYCPIFGGFFIPTLSWCDFSQLYDKYFDEGYILAFRNLLEIKIFEVELREIATRKGGYEKLSKDRIVILIIDHFCTSDPVKGIYLMF